MRTSRTSFLFFFLLSVFLSSCSSYSTIVPASSQIATETVTSSVTATSAPTKTITSSATAVPTKTIIPTHTPVITPAHILTPSNEPGLIVTLGERKSFAYRAIPVFSPDGQLIALAGPRIRIWDVKTYKLIREFENPYPEKCHVSEAKFSPNGNYFAVSITNCSREVTTTGHLLVWDVSTGTLLQEWVQQYAKMNDRWASQVPVYAMAFLPNSTTLVFANGHTLETRDIFQKDKADILKLGPEMFASQITLSSDGRLAYIIMDWLNDSRFLTHKTVYQSWNIGTHAMLDEIKYSNDSPDFKVELLNAALVEVNHEKGTSQITNLVTNEVRDLPYRLGGRYYNADGRLMIYNRLGGPVGSIEFSIELWNTDDWRNIYTFTPEFRDEWITNIAFSPDNTILAIEHQEQVSLWSIRPFVQP
jgi:WD40 repeat protein